MTGTQRRSDFIAVALLILLPTLFFGDVLLGKGDFYLRDLTRYYYPMKQVPRSIVRASEFPYWNRMVGAGQPLAANPEHEIFYPPTWLTWIGNYNLGFRLHILLHVYIALLAMYALLRSMTLRASSAFFGAVAYGLGGATLSLVNLLPMFFCAAWIPLACLFVRRHLMRPNARDFALASVVLGIECLVGEPTMLMQTALILLAYTVYHCIREKNARGVLWLAAIGVTGVLAGAVQMIPAIDLMRDSVRSEGFTLDLVGAWSMPPAKIAELVFPNILGHTSIDGVPWYWAGNLYPGLGGAFLFNIYCGLAMAAFVAAGVACRMRGTALFVSLFVFATLLALGAYTPLLRLLYETGIARSFRYPEKFILMGVFAGIVFGAKAFDRALDGDTRIRDAAAGFALATAVVAAAVSLLGYTPYSLNGFLAAFGLEPNEATFLMIARAWSDWGIAGLRGLILFVLLLTLSTQRRALWSAAAVVFICGDLAGVVAELNPRMPRSFFGNAPPIVNALPANGVPYRIFPFADWQNATPVARQFFRIGPQFYWVSRNGLFPEMNAGYGIASVMARDFDKTALMPTTDFVRSMWDIGHSGRPEWWPPLMAMSNAWYRTVFNDFDEEWKLAGGDPSKLAPVALVEAAHQPRYYFADQMVRIGDRHDFVRRLTSGAFSRNVAFTYAEPFEPARGIVHVARESSNRALLDIESFGRGFLVMSVTPHKYWRIQLDGHTVHPVIANVGFQGIVVPPGRHLVTMEYRNRLIVLSAVLSAITLAVLAACAVSGSRA